MQDYHKLFTKTEFWDINVICRNARPWPGRYPTRWRFVLAEGQKRVYEYNGKPSLFEIKRVCKLARTAKKGMLVLVEYDRAGAFKQSVVNLPYRDVIPVFTVNPTLDYFYMPFTLNGLFFGPWLTPLWTLRIKLGKRSWNVYAPWARPTTDEHFNKLREYRQWLNKSHPLKP